jgi:outer membrane protein assembly factor BamB
MKSAFASIFCLTLFGVTTAAFAQAPWPQWRGPERNGKSTVTNFNANWETKPPELLWTADGLGGGYASVSVSEDKIFTTGNLKDGQAVIATNTDGTPAWNQVLTEKVPKHGYEGSRSTPTLDGDRLYVVTSDGVVHCLKQSDGEVVWSRAFKDWGGRMMSGWGYSESPLVDGDLVVCTPGGQKGMIVALDKLTGKEVWASEMGEFGDKGKDGAGYSSIVISNGAGVKQYVQMTGRGVIGVRAEDGKFLWGYNAVANGTANIPTPVVSGDYVFASSGYGTGAGLVKLSKEGDGVKAEEQYFLKAGELQNHHGGMVLLDGYIYCGHRHNSGFPICVEMTTGKVAWGGDIRPEGKGTAAVVYVDGYFIFRYQSGDVVLIEATPKGYEVKGKFFPVFQQKESWSHPVVVGGRLYLREQDKLMCYDVAEAS